MASRWVQLHAELGLDLALRPSLASNVGLGMRTGMRKPNSALRVRFLRSTWVEQGVVFRVYQDTKVFSCLHDSNIIRI